MIPGKITRYLEERANLAYLGTRTRDLVPLGHRVSGWRLGADERTLTALVAAPVADTLLETLQDNGQIALTVEDFPAHETYQFKGRYLRHRPLEPGDVAAVDQIRARCLKSLRVVYPSPLPEMLVGIIVSTPGIAVEFEVREIYVQTPGPGAGKRLVPPTED